MNTSKRVSFGSEHGSIVETLIIENDPTPRQNGKHHHHYNYSQTNGYIDTTSTSPKCMESRDNPFLPDSDLSKETDDLLRRSTISRNTVILDDPAKSHTNSVHEDSIQPLNASGDQALPDSNQNSKLNDSGNHVVDGTASPQSVEVEVGIVAPSADSHMQVEHVKLKEKKKCACCVVM